MSAMQIFFSDDRRGEKWMRCTKCCYGAMRNVQGEREDWKTGLSSPAVTDLCHFFKNLAFNLVKLAVTFTCFQLKQFHFSCIMKFHLLSLFMDFHLVLYFHIITIKLV
jgi:hypothetical protein